MRDPLPKTPTPAKPELEILPFPTARHWERWLTKNAARSKGIWLQFFKKDSGIASITYAEALNVALCFGWIDGQIKRHDEQSWIHKFTPRRPKSMWSKRNRDLVEQLTKSGKMRPAGLKEVEAAKADGRWDQAYDSPSKMTVPEDFLKALAKNPTAMKFFKTLNKANTYAIAWRLQTAKRPETRQKRMQALIEMLAAEKKIHE
jgi:uncharacterized protein YdeI (YjbR/CyaY-like superfamily)